MALRRVTLPAMNAPVRIWITTLVTAGWIILALRFYFVKHDLSFTGLCAVAAAFYAYRLYLLTQHK